MNNQKIKNILYWFSQRSIFVIAVLLIAVGTLLVAKSGKLAAAADAGEERIAVAYVYKPIADGYLYFKSI